MHRLREYAKAESNQEQRQPQTLGSSFEIWQQLSKRQDKKQFLTRA